MEALGLPGAEQEEVLLRPENDLLEETESIIREQRQRLQSQEASAEEVLVALFAQEKKTRLAGDFRSTAILALQIVEISHDFLSFDEFLRNLSHIAKKRSQYKQAIIRLVKRSMEYLGQVSDIEKKLSLIETLREITEGKIYVEVERSRLTRMLAMIREDQGSVNDAAKIIQEVQIETVGSMDRLEKFEFILDQMRLCLASEDYIRCKLISQKVGARALSDKDFQHLRLRFYELMIQYHRIQDDTFEIARCYQYVFHTPCVIENESHWKSALENWCVYCLLSPFDAEQQDMILRIQSEKKLRELPIYESLIKQFIDDVLIGFDNILSELVDGVSHEAFSSETHAEKNINRLKKRVIEHNLRVISKHYSRIRLSRLSEILSLSDDETESYISDMVNVKTMYSKIDRVEGVVSFRPGKEPYEVLNEWSTRVTQLLDLVENTCQLIRRENMVYKIDH